MNIDDIRKFSPCYDPTDYLPEDWEGDALDILRVEECPAIDRLWVVTRPGWIDDKTLRLFAVWCARDALLLINEPDPRSVEACNVAERYANGDATDDELSAAWDAARVAAWDAAGAAAWDAAWDAAWVAAAAAARVAAAAAAAAAAWDAAGAAAWDAASVAAAGEQIEQLISMLEV